MPAMSEDVRSRMLELAIEAIEAGGEAAIRVNEIVHAAGVTAPMLYYHFGNRDGLVAAAMGERYRRSMLAGEDVLLEGLQTCTTQHEYAQLLLSVAIDAARSPAAAGRRRLRIQSLGAASKRPALQAAIEEAHRLSVVTLARIFAHGQERGWVLTDYSPSVLAALWWDMSNGHHISETYAEEADRDAINLALVDAIAHMLFGRTFPDVYGVGATTSKAATRPKTKADNGSTNRNAGTAPRTRTHTSSGRPAKRSPRTT